MPEAPLMPTINRCDAVFNAPTLPKGLSPFSSPQPAFLASWLTREGRSIVVTIAENRRRGMSDAERAALHKSMLAYSDKYRIEGNDFITVVDVSWNEEWNGTEQRRHFRIEGR